jgi:hypothetical protein
MDSPRPQRLRSALLTLFATLGAAVLLAGCGGAGSDTGTAAATTRAAAGRTAEERLVALERRSTHGRRVAHLDRIREAVIHGASADFAIGTGIGGPSFESCVKGLLREALDGPTIGSLVAVYRRPHGLAYAARSLNGLTAPLAADCGHRYWVPELVEAARGLRNAAPIGAAIQKLGVAYGPYLGRRCRHVHRGCGLVGIDIVLDHAATRVEAVAGSQTIRLRTPGKHDGVRYHDWVGTFTRTGFARTPRPHRDLVHVGVELRVRYADGRRARALFPHVLVSSGWG